MIEEVDFEQRFVEAITKMDEYLRRSEDYAGYNREIDTELFENWLEVAKLYSKFLEMSIEIDEN